ncbi:sphingosine-1-phosphate phosphatase 2 isoform X2 [Mycetomoellerius zeteki]|uniref:sphingosine-1-phosphate phosphatase 2 isoform X2 n=1 Tax=Mycetomoellerius zeteki TaxID=64791 RepID=UPI00084E853A|nr:PREDICTED: sphingosine-1-phosphate phosphatase 2-like isoform X2 [Trachymyrmex zeteki]
MLLKLIRIMDYLKDPQLVASIQQFFGVKICYNKHKKTFQEEEKKYTKIDDNEENYIPTCHINDCDANQRLNAYTKQVNSLEQTIETMNKEALMVSNNPNYTITNSFWYYTFVFGTELGDEIFYSTFIPFLFWNIDGAVGQRVVLVWGIIMTFGQILKDIICWPRPACPPVVRLQNKWSQEYGMPSTHAMVGLTIPFSVVLFTMNKYIYPFSIGCIIASLWCTLVSMSRLYLAMLIAISIAIIKYYPSSYKWTPTRSDTAMVVSVTTGIHAGAWLNYYTGLLTVSQFLPPFHIVWPTYSVLGHLIIRTALGFSGVILTKAICKSFSYIIICGILQINWRELMKCQDYNSNQNKVFVDLVYKYVFCFMLGVNTVHLFPQVFNIIGIERPAFYTEI